MGYPMMSLHKDYKLEFHRTVPQNPNSNRLCCERDFYVEEKSRMDFVRNRNPIFLSGWRVR